MHRGLLTALASACAALGAALSVPQTAGAQDATTLTVTPDTGLHDGQVVSVAGAGYAGVFAIGALECPPQFGGRTQFTVTEVLQGCGFLELPAALAPDSAGSVSASVPVQEVFTTSTQASYDCTVRNDCVLLVAGLAGAGLRGASAPIRFGPATPATRSDCTSGGWRELADDTGVPFSNQGRCVRFVVTHRR